MISSSWWQTGGWLKLYSIQAAATCSWMNSHLLAFCCAIMQLCNDLEAASIPQTQLTLLLWTWGDTGFPIKGFCFRIKCNKYLALPGISKFLELDDGLDMCLIYSSTSICKGGPEAGFKVGISLAQVWTCLLGAAPNKTNKSNMKTHSVDPIPSIFCCIYSLWFRP